MKKVEKKSGHSIALAVLSSIILTILLVSLTNVGLSIFLESPQYDDYCNTKTQEKVETEVRCTQLGGEWDPDGKTYPTRVNSNSPDLEEIDGYCELFAQCRNEYNSARESYNQNRYYVFAFIGFILLLIGMFSLMHSLQYTGLATGAILITQGIVTNFENKITVFISLILILIVFGILVYKKIEKR